MLGKESIKLEELNLANDKIGESISSKSIDDSSPNSDEKNTSNRNVSKGLKWFTAIFSICFLTFSVFCVIMSINKISNSTNKKDNYITLTNSNYANSRKVYESFGTNNQNKLKDFAVIGNKLFLSEHKITANQLYENATNYWSSDNSNFSLLNLSTETSEYHKTNFANGVNFIDLSKCEEGDYLIYNQLTNNTPSKNNAEINPYSFFTNDSINLSFYSLPNKEGKRKKITIKNNKISPFTVITVLEVGSQLPLNTYDGILSYQIFDNYYLKENQTPGEAENSALEKIADQINKQTHFKFITSSSLLNMKSTKAVLSFSLSKDIEEDFISSIFISKNNSSVLQDGTLKGYDRNPEVRELTGYLDHAGQGYFDVIGNDIFPTDYDYLGKESYLLNISDATDLTTKIIDFLNSITE